MRESSEDRYVWQTWRQNKGLTCTDCGSHQGHFGFCPLFHKGLPSTQNPCYHTTYEENEGRPQPDSQSFYRRAQQEMKAATLELNDYDRELLKGMNIKL